MNNFQTGVTLKIKERNDKMMEEKLINLDPKILLQFKGSNHISCKWIICFLEQAS